MEKDAYTLPEVSEKTGVSVRTLRRYIHNGRIKAVKMGGNRFVVSRENFLKFINGEWLNWRVNMELVGEYKVCSKHKVDKKLVYKREVRTRTVGNMTVPEIRYYTEDYCRLDKIQEDIFVGGTYHSTIEYFEYKEA